MIPELMDGEVDVRIHTPLPASVLMSLGGLIDAAWPGAQLVNGRDGEVTFRVNNAERRELPAEAAAALRLTPSDEELVITGLGPDGMSMSTPADLAAILLPVLKASFADNPDAANYLETQITDLETHRRYVMIFAKSAAQTPHELRTRAEENLATARQDAHAANTAAVQRVLLGPRAGRADTFEDGVKAALDAMRALNFGNAAA